MPRPPQVGEKQDGYWYAGGDPGDPKSWLKEFDLPAENTVRQWKTAIGLLTTADQKRQIDVLTKNYPDLVYYEDEKGNVIVDGSAYGGEPGYLNAPGISGRDLRNLGFNVAAFIPTGRVIGGVVQGAGKLFSAAATAVGLGATQAGITAVNDAAGADTTPKDYLLDTGVAAATGAAADTLMRVIGPRIGPVISKYRMQMGKVTPDMVESVRAAIKEAGVPERQIDESLILNTLQRAAQAAGVKLGEVNNSILDDVLQGAHIGPTAHTAESGNRALAEEFHTQLTAGQATEDPTRLWAEDAMRHGGRGGPAQGVMRGFDLAQNRDLENARGMVLDRLTPGGMHTVDSVAGGTQAVGDAVRSVEKSADKIVSEAYGEVGDAFLSAEGLSGLLSRVRGSVRRVDFDPNLPQTNSLLKDITKTQKLLTSFKGRIKPYHIKQIELMRRRLNTAAGSAEGSDLTQVSVMKKAFDDYVNEAVEGALFSGDEGVLNVLKEARSLRTEYGRVFEARPIRTSSGRILRDETGELIERIVYKNPTGEELANWLFGVSKLSRPGAERAVKRIGNIVGRNSQEWHMLRQAAFLRLTGGSTGMTPASAQVYSKRLQEAVYGDGAQLMRELFTKDEVRMFQRLGKLMRLTDPYGGPTLRAAANRSGSAYRIASDAINLLGQLISMPVRAVPMGSAGLNTAGKIVGDAAATIGARNAIDQSMVTAPLFTRYTALGLPVGGALQGNED